MFFSSHVLSEVERVCDRVGIIRDGRLVTVEPTHALVDKAFRHVRLTFDGPVDREPFEKLRGVEDLRVEGPRVFFTLHEAPDEMVKLAAEHRLVSLEYEHPSLEEIFLTYYGDHEDGGRS